MPLNGHRAESYVLLVAPDREVGGDIATALLDAGYDVRWFIDGEAAITHLQEEFVASQRESLDRTLAEYVGREAPRVSPDPPRVPSLVLIDLLVPVTNGWRLASVLQERESLRRVPLLILSSDSRAEGREDLARPDPEEIVAAARRLAGPPR